MVKTAADAAQAFDQGPRAVITCVFNVIYVIYAAVGGEKHQ
jgi:hypothetical protein